MPLTRRCAKRGWLASISLPWLIILPWPLTIDHWPWDNAPSSPFSKEMNLPSNVLTRRCAKRRWLASIFLPWQPRSRPNTLRQIEVSSPHPLSATLYRSFDGLCAFAPNVFGHRTHIFSYASSSSLHPCQWVSQSAEFRTSVALRLASLLLYTYIVCLCLYW